MFNLYPQIVRLSFFDKCRNDIMLKNTLFLSDTNIEDDYY